MEEVINKKQEFGWRRLLLLFGAAVIFLLVGIIAGGRVMDHRYTPKDVRKFEKALHKKERL